MKIRFSFVIGLFSFFIFFMSCQRSTEPLPANNRPPIKKVHLSAEDASCTEAWLKLTTENPEEDSLNHQLTLYRDEQAIDTMLFSGKDTLLYDRTLQPSKSYTYFARIYADSQLAAISDTVTVTTLDTTSHDFEWQSWEFGGVHGSSYFNDVAIIDENDIWAVGEIHTAETDQYDSSGNWVQPYNAAHWDGEKWELKRIYFYLCPNGTYGSTYPIETVFVFDKNNIWFSEGGSFVRWDGVKFKHDCSINKILTGGIRKIWGESSSDFYVVGTNGLIAHYDGKEWRRIESGISVSIQDIWGIRNNKTGENIILAVASEELSGKKPFVLKITKSSCEKLKLGNIPVWPYGIWSADGRYWFISGGRIYQAYIPVEKSWRKLGELANYFCYGIRGNSINDLYVVGMLGRIFHWNGKTWYKARGLTGYYYSVDVKGDVVVAVGITVKGNVADKAQIVMNKK